MRLDVIPSDLVEAVELNKTLSANQDANGIGGSVNLRTKEAGDQPTFNLFGDGGYTPIENGRGSYDFGGTVGKRFGATKKFGVLGNAAYDYNGRGIDNIQPSLDPRSTFAQPFYDNDTIREYRYYRHRYGFAGSTDYKFNDNASIYATRPLHRLQGLGRQVVLLASLHRDQLLRRATQPHRGLTGSQVLHLEQAPRRLGRQR